MFLFYAKCVETAETICLMSQTAQQTKSRTDTYEYFDVAAVIKTPTQTPTWPVTTNCTESIQQLHYR
jgi:hypothetical protein